MTPHEHDQVSKVFFAVCDLPAERRERELERRCDGRDWLRTEVESLLRHHDVPAAAIDSPAVSRPALSDFDEPAPLEHLPKRIGQYRVLSIVGQGGMGTVYLAEQDRPRRVVAVKVMRFDLLSKSMLRRFEFEQEALGRLQHPGIAQIFEAGIHVPDGEAGRSRPYFAMEYVEGLPLNEYVGAHDLGTRDRLDMLVKICEAVEHAHQRGVIHRDLKPGNILVDDAGQPKILDFGVARAVTSGGGGGGGGSDREETTLHTLVGQLIGTVNYMSPEQVGADAHRIDPRSDVYALGVICYELLAGRLPHDTTDRSLPDAARLIRDEDPTPLSSVNRIFRGELDTIVAKALEKDPARRYQSAAEFGADISRYLNDEPIVARPASAAYQLRKFARRNRALVGGAAAAFILLVLGIVGTSIGMHRALASGAEHAALRHEAEQEQQRASRAALKAERVSRFLRETLMAADPHRAHGRNMLLRDAVDLAAQRVERDLGDEPDIAADLLLTIGSAYHSLGLYESAREYLLRAHSLLHDMHGPSRPELVDVLLLLSRVADSTGDYREAADLADQAIQLAETNQEVDDTRRFNALNRFAEALVGAGRHRDAEPIFRRVAEQMQIEPSRFTADFNQTVHNNLASTLRSLHRLAEAEPLFERVLGEREATLPPNHPYLAVSLANLAQVRREQGRHAEAEDLFHRAIQIQRSAFGDSHLKLASNLSGLANTLRAQGKFEDSAESLAQAIGIAREAGGEAHPMLATLAQNLAMLRHEMNDPQTARALYEEALEIHTARGETEPLRLATVLANYAGVLIELEELEAAGRAADSSLAIRREHLGVHPSTALSLHLTARIKAESGRLDEALLIFDEAMEMLRTTVGEEHVWHAVCNVSRARALLNGGRAEEAEAHSRRALAALRTNPRAELSVIFRCEDILVESLITIGRHDDAVHALDDAARHGALTSAAEPRLADIAARRALLTQSLASDRAQHE